MNKTTSLPVRLHDPIPGNQATSSAVGAARAVRFFARRALLPPPESQEPIRPMPRPRLVLPVALAGLCFGVAAPAVAGEPVATLPAEILPADQPPPRFGAIGRLWRWSDTRVRDIFDTILPDTQERRTWRLNVEPRIGDITGRDHVRVPVGVTYGFNKRTEGELEVEPYFDNPFGDGGRNGIAHFRGNLKRQWKSRIDDSVAAASGFRFSIPTASVPEELSHGVNRYSVYTTFSRPSPTIRDLEAFLNLSYDVLTESRAAGRIREEYPQDDFSSVTIGTLYRRGRLTYGLALAWEHTFDGPTTNYLTLKPSVVFEVPKKYTLKSPGQWLLGTALELKRYGNEYDVGVKLRVRWRGDARRAFRQWSENIRHDAGH